MTQYQPNKSPAWGKLNTLAGAMSDQRIADLIADPVREMAYGIELPGLFLDYTKHLVNDEIMASLIALAEDADVTDKAQRLYDGEIINPTEHRAALHPAMRGGSPRLSDETRQAIAGQHAKLADASNRIRSGAWVGITGKPISDVVNLGIGGSDLGPRMAYTALGEFVHAPPRCHFIANVDGAEINQLLMQLDPATTLFIISSKSFSTSGNAAECPDSYGLAECTPR